MENKESIELDILKIVDYLHKHYKINKNDAYEIINIEWDFIEESLNSLSLKDAIKYISEELIKIYMVA